MAKIIIAILVALSLAACGEKNGAPPAPKKVATAAAKPASAAPAPAPAPRVIAKHTKTTKKKKAIKVARASKKTTEKKSVVAKTSRGTASDVTPKDGPG